MISYILNSPFFLFFVVLKVYQVNNYFKFKTNPNFRIYPFYYHNNKIWPHDLPRIRIIRKVIAESFWSEFHTYLRSFQFVSHSVFKSRNQISRKLVWKNFLEDFFFFWLWCDIKIKIVFLSVLCLSYLLKLLHFC